MIPYRVTIRLSRSNRGGAAGNRIRLSPRQLQACAERPRSPGGNLTTGTVPAGRADTSPQPGNGCRCLWQGCDDPEKCPVDPPGSMSLVSICLSLRGQAFGSRLDPGYAAIGAADFPWPAPGECPCRGPGVRPSFEAG